MLPDFAGMIRARPPVADHTELAEGIAFHHATDHAFHDSATFRALTAQANAELSAGGLRRGKRPRGSPRRSRDPARRRARTATPELDERIAPR